MAERASRTEQRHEAGSEGSAERAKHRRGHASPWEWVAAGVSAVVVLSVIGLMLYEAVTGSGLPPEMNVEVTGGYLVQFDVRNTGERTGAEVTVEGELRSGEQVVESSQVTIDYVPAEAVRSGGLFFTRDPAAHSLEVRVLGYDEP